MKSISIKRLILSTVGLPLLILGCSKDQSSPKPQNSFIIENISNQILYVFNNDPMSPEENFDEITINPSQKKTVLSSRTSLNPMIRPSQASFQTEYTFNNQTNIYQVNAYENILEASISGDASAVSVYFPNTTTGRPDSLMNVKLPIQINYKSFSSLTINLTISKEVISGKVQLSTKIKGKDDTVKSTTASHGVITYEADLTKKTSNTTINEPTTTNPGNSSGCGRYNGKAVYTGPKGGCYYINSNGNKTYVARSYCCG